MCTSISIERSQTFIFLSRKIWILGVLASLTLSWAYMSSSSFQPSLSGCLKVTICTKFFDLFTNLIRVLSRRMTSKLIDHLMEVDWILITVTGIAIKYDIRISIELLATTDWLSLNILVSRINILLILWLELRSLT